jgi:hypothetical protein
MAVDRQKVKTRVQEVKSGRQAGCQGRQKGLEKENGEQEYGEKHAG